MISIPPLMKPRDESAPRWFHIAVALSMLLSAVTALVAALNTSRTMTALVEQNARMVRATATPLLEFGHGNLDDKGLTALSFTLTNQGHGLARVVWFELRVDGKARPGMDAVIRALDPTADPKLSYASAAVAPRVFAGGAEQRFFHWEQPPAKDTAAREAWQRLDKARFKRIEVEACYCSVFEECWTSRLVGDLPKPVAECRPEGHTTLNG
jgi:hypothetical protein